MSNPNEKGNALENAVEAIERFLISHAKIDEKAAISIERKKIIVIDGVKHEIDLYVHINLGNDYELIYIFECKNWEDNVGKNEIIVFSEKIDVTKAQKGYFVAKGFTEYAKKQALKDNRMELLLANDQLDTIGYVTPANSYGTEIYNVNVTEILDQNGSLMNFDENSVFSFNGGQSTFKEILIACVEDASRQAHDNGTLPVGEHRFHENYELDLMPVSFLIDTVKVIKMKLSAEFSIFITAPIVVSVYDVEKRGRTSIVKYETPQGNYVVQLTGKEGSDLVANFYKED